MAIQNHFLDFFTCRRDNNEDRVLIDSNVILLWSGGPDARNMYHYILEKKTRIIEKAKNLHSWMRSSWMWISWGFCKNGSWTWEGWTYFLHWHGQNLFIKSFKTIFVYRRWCWKRNFKSEACKRQLQCFNNKLNLECQTESISLSTRYPWGTWDSSLLLLITWKQEGNDLGELCRLYDISYLESGTEGQGSSYRVILKNTCQPYQVTIQNVSEKGNIANCTLKSFPYKRRALCWMGERQLSKIVSFIKSSNQLQGW